MTKKIEMIVCESPEEAPSNFYILNCLSQAVFFKTKSREKAQQACDEEYGKGFYKIRVIDLMAKGGKDVTAR